MKFLERVPKTIQRDLNVKQKVEELRQLQNPPCVATQNRVPRARQPFWTQSRFPL
jgi:hypothetical protein